MALVKFQNRVFDPAAIVCADITFPDPDATDDQDVVLEVWIAGTGEEPFLFCGDEALLLWRYLNESQVFDDVMNALLRLDEAIAAVEDAA